MAIFVLDGSQCNLVLTSNFESIHNRTFNWLRQRWRECMGRQNKLLWYNRYTIWILDSSQAVRNLLISHPCSDAGYFLHPIWKYRLQAKFHRKQVNQCIDRIDLWKVAETLVSNQQSILLGRDYYFRAGRCLEADLPHKSAPCGCHSTIHLDSLLHPTVQVPWTDILCRYRCVHN